MKELIDKLSSYNILNYLIPGTLFAFIVSQTTTYKLIQTDVFIGILLYYFIGLLISRFGSLIVEPLLIKIKFIRYADYKDFIEAEKKDAKISVMLEANNMYRSLFSMCFIIGLCEIINIVQEKYKIKNLVIYSIMLVLVIICFGFSYRKQTDYIFKRVNNNLNK
jgi:hypothetical protein